MEENVNRTIVMFPTGLWYCFVIIIIYHLMLNIGA